MREAFYVNSISGFLSDSDSVIRDSLTEGTSKVFYQQLSSQTESWSSLIHLLKNSLFSLQDKTEWGILLEYSIPRRAKRIDAILIAGDLIFVIEYKDKEMEYDPSYMIQAEDYCLDLRDFHFESKDRIIIPVVLCPEAPNYINNFYEGSDYVQTTLLANRNTLQEIILQTIKLLSRQENNINYKLWNESKYFPTPTIIEAAQSLYAGQNVKEISRSHAGAENLTQTTNAVIDAIKEAQANNSKIICFITGVPGAGKTLAGLNIVHNREFKTDDKELGVFLSGNSPLVKVLSEALSRDTSKRDGINKKEANRRVSTFIHNVHQFIDEYYEDEAQLPVDRVLVYDEAQRAWTKEYKYFKSKKRINASEPEILLSIMNRFKNSWAVIIALVGGGQEINTGEGGLAEWGKALEEKFSDWRVYISPELKTGDHNGGLSLFKQIPQGVDTVENSFLHLRVAIRSYKAVELTKWVDLVLSNLSNEANEIFKSQLRHFPVFITRSLEKGKYFLKQRARGSRRYGIIASSGAKRLRAIGIDVNSGLKGTSHQNELGAWYLNSSNDVRSSNFLEVVGSEFGVQGLELDWTCVCWDGDLRRSNDNWDFKGFEGTKWFNVKQNDQQRYILNKYRVLLTRAREGMILFIPEGDEEDETRLPEMYNGIFDYLKSSGIKEI